MTEDLEQGLILMAAGMGTVYVLLALLVWLVGLVSKVSRRLEHAGSVTNVPPPSAPPTSANDGELVGVISAAVKVHRERQSRREP